MKRTSPHPRVVARSLLLAVSLSMVPIVYPVLHALVFSCLFIIPCRYARLDKKHPPRVLALPGHCFLLICGIYTRVCGDARPRAHTHTHTHTTCKCERKLARRCLSKKRSLVRPSSRDSLSLSHLLSFFVDSFSRKERGENRATALFSSFFSDIVPITHTYIHLQNHMYAASYASVRRCAKRFDSHSARLVAHSRAAYAGNSLS